MYRWYSSAKVCYVYLSDHAANESLTEESLGMCRWITRSWTLQELIAPGHVEFYAQDWSYVGSKADKLYDVAAATAIHVDALKSSDMTAFSVAQRMSWAAKRQCTIVENSAYSLMGLSDIYMPMLYGEGAKAFIRLQEEIDKSTYVPSIFAWIDDSADSFTCRGLLANKAADFEHCSSLSYARSFDDEAPYSITNVGFQLRVDLEELDAASDTYVFPLTGVSIDDKYRFGVYLKRIHHTSHHYVRMHPYKLHSADSYDPTRKQVYQNIYVRQKAIIPTDHVPSSIYAFRCTEILARTEYMQICRVWPVNAWDETSRLLRVDSSAACGMGVIWLDAAGYDWLRCAIVMYFDKASRRASIVVTKAIADNVPDDTVENCVTKAIQSSQYSNASALRLTFNALERAMSVQVFAAMQVELLVDKIIFDISMDVIFRPAIQK